MSTGSPSPKLLERPLLLPLVAAIAGICCAGLFSWYIPEQVAAPLVAVSFLSIFLTRRTPFYLSIAILLFCWGNLSLKPLLRPELPQNHVGRLLFDDPVIVEGVIDSRPEATETGSRIYLQVEQILRDKHQLPAAGRLLLYIREGHCQFLTGDRIRFLSRVQKPRNYGLPGEFDYVAYLSYRSVHATAFVKKAGNVILMRRGVKFLLQQKVDSLAAKIGSFIDTSVGGTEAAILRALLIGDGGRIPKATKDAYSRTGVNHILSISGFHVGIIALFMFQILMRAARTSEFLLIHLNLRRFIMLVTLPLIVFYLFLSGAAPATTRSVIMIAVYVVALVLEREVEPINSLMLAALVLLAVSPGALFDISFQLSFLALWGIILLTPLFMNLFRIKEEGAAGKLSLFMMASAAAIAATALPVAYYFHRVSTIGLLSNILIVPLMGYGAVIIGFSAIPCMFFAPPAGKFLLWVAGFLVKVSNEIIAVLANLPTLPLFTPSRLDLLVFYLLLAVLTFVMHRRNRLICCAILACVWGLLLVVPSGGHDGKLTINFLSVGQGESTLITFPDGRNMLVDGGGNVREGGQDVGERLLAPALWTLGVRKIDWILLTHPHPDHLQGLKYVAANFPVGAFWEGVAPKGGADYEELRRRLADREVPVHVLSSADAPIALGNVRIEPLGPQPGSTSSADGDEEDANDDSVVFRLVLGEFSMLFTGDIGFSTEEMLCRHPELLKSTVLKVPHHGSRYSSSPQFLNAVSPDLALISAGYRNSFHLPAVETVENLQRRKIRILRTDLDGTIRIRCDIDGRNMRYESLAGHFH